MSTFIDESPDKFNIFRVYQENHSEDLTIKPVIVESKKEISFATRVIPQYTCDDKPTKDLSVCPALQQIAVTSAAEDEIILITDVNEFINAQNFPAAEHLLGRKLTVEEMSRGSVFFKGKKSVEDQLHDELDREELKAKIKLVRAKPLTIVVPSKKTPPPSSSATPFRTPPASPSSVASNSPVSPSSPVHSIASSSSSAVSSATKRSSFMYTDDNGDDAYYDPTVYYPKLLAWSIRDEMEAQFLNYKLPCPPSIKLRKNATKAELNKALSDGNQELMTILHFYVNTPASSSSAAVSSFPPTVVASLAPTVPSTPALVNPNFAFTSNKTQMHYNPAKSYKEGQCWEIITQMKLKHPALGQPGGPLHDLQFGQTDVKLNKAMNAANKLITSASQVTGSGLIKPRVKAVRDWVPFGKFVLDLTKLKAQHVFCLAYPVSKQKPEFIKNAEISRPLLDCVHSYLAGEPMDTSVLTDAEKEWMHYVWEKALGIKPKTSVLRITTKKVPSKKELLLRLKIALGEIEAGNDNPLLIVEMRDVMKRLEFRGWLSDVEIIKLKQFIALSE